MTPEFQNTYGNKKDMYESWGEKLLTPTSYDPKKDFFNTGTNFINSVTLTTGTKSNQTLLLFLLPIPKVLCLIMNMIV